MASKIVIVGDEGVGKSSFVQFVKNREFSAKYTQTDGADVCEYKVDEKKLEIWDCTGKKTDIREAYWIGAKAVIVMFDINSLRSWKNAAEWIEKVKNVAGDVPTVLVGTKVDLRGVVDKGMVARGLFALRRKYPKLRYAECSAKIGYGCDEVVTTVLQLLG